MIGYATSTEHYSNPTDDLEATGIVAGLGLWRRDSLRKMCESDRKGVKTII